MTLCYSNPEVPHTLRSYCMFKQSEWKPAFALLIARNAVSEQPSKTQCWKVWSQEATRHVSCLFSLFSQCFCAPVSEQQPSCPNSKGKRMCKKEQRGEKKGSGKQVFELQSHGTVLQPHRWSSRHECSLDVHIIKHVCAHPHAHITVRSHRMLLLSLLLVSTSTDTKTTATEIV